MVSVGRVSESLTACHALTDNEYAGGDIPSLVYCSAVYVLSHLALFSKAIACAIRDHEPDSRS